LIHSPHPGRDASVCRHRAIHSYFNPLSPSGERQFFDFISFIISIFQPTLPIRGETFYLTHLLSLRTISTHSPHPGRDNDLWVSVGMRSDFNPLSPSGERPSWKSTTATINKFQPTLPIRGETLLHPQPHSQHRYFNPLSPSGERLILFLPIIQPLAISTHSPHPGRDPLAKYSTKELIAISTHSPHPGRDSRSHSGIQPGTHFNPLSPSGERLGNRIASPGA